MAKDEASKVRISYKQELERAEDLENLDRTDAYAQGAGYLGVDDLDKIRRDMLKHQTHVYKE